MSSNDYKSMVGFWNKLNLEEKRIFVKKYIQGNKDIIGNGLVYYGFSRGSKKNEEEKNIINKK